MKNLTKIAFATALAFGSAAYADQHSIEWAEVGSLNCDIGAGTGFIFGSSKELNCTFNPVAEGAADEQYIGVIRKYGVDIGRTEAGVMNWVVLAPTTDDPWEPGSIAGIYGGVSAEATVVGGVGANAMFGGNSETVVLQPISLSASEGLNLAMGIGEIQLAYVD